MKDSKGASMTDKQKQDILFYLDMFNKTQNLLCFSLYKNSIIIDSWTSNGVEECFDVSLDDTVEDRFERKYSIKEDGLLSFLKYAVEDRWYSFDPDDETELYAQNREREKGSWTISEFVKDMERYDEGFGKANDKIAELCNRIQDKGLKKIKGIIEHLPPDKILELYNSYVKEDSKIYLNTKKNIKKITKTSI